MVRKLIEVKEFLALRDCADGLYDINDPVDRLRIGAEIVAWAADCTIGPDEYTNCDNVKFTSSDLIDLGYQINMRDREERERKEAIEDLARDMFETNYPDAKWGEFAESIKEMYLERAENLIDKGWTRK